MCCYAYRPATPEDLNRIWDQDIAANEEDSRWPLWKAQYVEYNRRGEAKTFVVLRNGAPIGQGTLLFSPACEAIGGRTELAGGTTANINALRIARAWEGQGHISQLIRAMEDYAARAGCSTLTIGVEAREARTLAIYLHWGYCSLVTAAQEDGALVLYYSKAIPRAKGCASVC